MIFCLVFGHKPHDLFEYQRNGGHRLTYCERCGQGVTHVVTADFPLPAGSKSRADWDDDNARRMGGIVADRVSSEIEILTQLRKAEIARLLARHTAKGTAKKKAPLRKASKGGRK
jgi:hypothetical protein